MKLKNLLDNVYRFILEFRKPEQGSFSGQDAEGYYFVIDQRNGQKVFVSHQRRLGYFHNGVLERVNKLSREYCVEDLVLSPESQVIDVGAHSGEFGLWVRQFGSRYLAIEPDPVAFGALARNFGDSILVNEALGANPGKSTFSLNTSTGDSSFGASSGKKIVVKVSTLSDVANRLFPTGPIDLLKIEAEGYEPEVLAGARSILPRVERITVDAGEEREGKSTAPECVTLLTDQGFRLKKVYLKRGVFYFENPELISQN